MVWQCRGNDLPALQERHPGYRCCETSSGQRWQGEQADDHASATGGNAGGEESEREKAMSKRKNMTPEQELEWKRKRAADARRYYAQDPCKFRARSAKYANQNKEKQKAYRRKYHEEHREMLNQRSKKWREENPELMKNLHREWESKNKAHRRAYVDANREKYRVADRAKNTRLTNAYIAARLGLPVKLAKQHPDIIEAKREQIQILRILKPKTKKQNAPESK